MDDLKINDRVIISNSDMNPLTDYYITEILEDEYICKMSYGIFSGIINVSKEFVSKHPIQESTFTFELTFDGPSIPRSNNWSVYISKYNNSFSLYRIPLFCIKEILNNINDRSMLLKLKEIIQDSFVIGQDPILKLNDWISGSVEALDENCKYSCRVEYTDVVPIKALYNSEFILDYYVTGIFLLCFTLIMLKLKLIDTETVLEILNKYI